MDRMPVQEGCSIEVSQKRTFLIQGRMGQWHSSRLKVFQKLFAVGGFPTNGMVTWYPGSPCEIVLSSPRYAQ